MAVRLRNITNQVQTIQIVRPSSTYSYTVYPQNFRMLTDEEYAAVNPPLIVGVWEVEIDPSPGPTPDPDPEVPGNAATTDDLPEGILNLYYTPARVAGKVETATNVGTGEGNIFKQKVGTSLQLKKIKAGANVTVTEVADDIVIASTGGGGLTDTDDLAEGSTNLYFTTARARTAAVADVITDGVTNVAPSQNAVYDALVLKADADSVVASLAAEGETALLGAVTLSEGANITLTQVGNDIEISSTGGGGLTDTDDLAEGSTNLYFTEARAKAAAVANSISDSITDVAPSQNAVFDALALKAVLSGNNTFAGSNTFLNNVDTEYALSITKSGTGFGLIVDHDPTATSPNPSVYISAGNNTTGNALNVAKFNTGSAVYIEHLGSSGPALELKSNVTGAAIQLTGSTSGSITLDVPATITSYTVTLPNIQGGAGEVLANDGSGNLSWVSNDGLWVNDDPNMYFTSGNVGVGIVSTPNRLSVSFNSMDPTQESEYQFAIYTGVDRSLTLGADDDFSYLQSWANKPLQVGIMGNDTLFHTNGFGRVGIGTATPSSLLDVVMSGSITAFKATQAGTAPGAVISTAPGSGVTLDLQSNSSSGLILLRGSTSGSVGINTHDVVSSYSLTLPASQGANGSNLQNDGSGGLIWATGGLQGAFNVGNEIITTGTPLIVEGTGLTGTVVGINALGGDGVEQGQIALAVSSSPSAVTTQPVVLIQSNSNTEGPNLRVTKNGPGYAVSIEGGATGSGAEISSGAVGNTALVVNSTNAGTVAVRIDSTSGGDYLQFVGSTSGSVALNAPATITDYTLVLPTAQGAAGEVLVNNGSGVLSWSAQSGGSLQDAYESGNTLEIDAFSISINNNDNVNNVASIVAIQNNVAPVIAASNQDGPAIHATASGTNSVLELTANTATRAHLKLTDFNNPGYGYFIKSPDLGILEYDIDWLLPSVQGGTGQVLTNSGAGVLSWTDKSDLTVVDVTLSPSDISALDTTPVLLVPAPGGSEYVQIERMELFVDFETTPYTAGADLDITYVSSGGIAMAPIQAAEIEASADINQLYVLPYPIRVSLGDGIQISSTASSTGGDSPMKFRIWYRTVTALT